MTLMEIALKHKQRSKTRADENHTYVIILEDDYETVFHSICYAGFTSFFERCSAVKGFIQLLNKPKSSVINYSKILEDLEDIFGSFFTIELYEDDTIVAYRFYKKYSKISKKLDRALIVTIGSILRYADGEFSSMWEAYETPVTTIYQLIFRAYQYCSYHGHNVSDIISHITRNDKTVLNFLVSTYIKDLRLAMRYINTVESKRFFRSLSEDDLRGQTKLGLAIIEGGKRGFYAKNRNK